MAGERARKIIKESQDATTEALRAWEESGALQHLRGHRLDLSDESPDWFMHSLLKRENLSLPAVERSKDLDRAEREATAILERLRRRRAWLAGPDAQRRPEQVRAFNSLRATTLDEYRAALAGLNKAILHFNLTAPAPLHRRGFRLDETVARVAGEIPPLDEPAEAALEPPARSPRRTLWQKLRGKQP